MKKITVWLTATAAALALVVAYQLNAAGVGGKSGDDNPPPPSSSVSAPATPSSGAGGDHVSKPGENK